MAETEARKQWVEANREYLRAYHRAWRAANRERLNANLRKQTPRIAMTPEERILANRATQARFRASGKRKAYDAAHREEARESCRKSYAKNGHKRKATVARVTREWALNNPDRRIINEQRRRARLLSAPGDGITHEQWDAIKGEYSNRCAYCWSSAPLQLDHIEPVSKGGAHDVTNAAPACRRCNASKSNSTLIVWLARQNRRAA